MQGILGPRRPEVRVVGHELHKLHGEEEGEQRNERREAQRDIVAHAHDAVYGVEPALAVVLGHEHARAALDAEDNERQDVEHGVCHRHGGELRLAQGADHE